MDLRKKMKEKNDSNSIEKACNNLPRFLDNFSLHIPEHQSYALQYVDDDKRVSRIVESLQESLSHCGKVSVTGVRAELISGHSGIGKSRLASEVAKTFQEQSPDTRITVPINLTYDNIRRSIKEINDVNPMDILGAILANKLFMIDSNEYKINWEIFSLLLRRHLPRIEAVVLIVDHFKSALDITKQILSACGTLQSKPNEFYVLPIFVGTNAHLYFPKSTNGMTTHVTMLISLSKNAREAMAESLAKAIDVPTEHLRKALGSILEDCGGCPSCFDTLWAILTIPSHEDALQNIRAFGEIDIRTVKKIREFLVDRLATEVGNWRIASFAWENLVEVPKSSAAAHSAMIKCDRIGRLVLNRLVLVAETGIEVPLDQPILQPKRDQLEKDDPNVTYQQIGSIVEIQPNPNNSRVGKVVMCAVILAAAKMSLGINIE